MLNPLHQLIAQVRQFLGLDLEKQRHNDRQNQAFKDLSLEAAKAEVNGITINYYHKFSGNPLVILLHGLTDSGIYWHRVIQALLDDYDLIIPDLRGHGYSSKPRAGYTYTDFSNDIIYLVQKLNIEKATIIGHSIGADIALLVAAKQSKRICRLILEDPPWEDPLPTQDTKQLEAANLLKELTGYASQSLEDLRLFYNNTVDNAHPIDADTWAQSQKLVSLSVVEWITSSPLSWESIIPNITCPVLLLTGDISKGSLVAERTSAKAKALSHMLNHEFIANAGHTIHRDQFDDFIRVCLKFLKSTDC